MGYPSRADELAILSAHAEDDVLDPSAPVVTAADVHAMATAVKGVRRTGPRRVLVDLAVATRRHPAIALGMPPRATLSLQRVTRAWAATAGRGYVTPDDVKRWRCRSSATASSSPRVPVVA